MVVNKKFRIEMYVKGNEFLGEIGKMPKIRRNINNVIREKYDY